MKKLILILSFLFCSFTAFAQISNPHATIVDGDGTTWFNAQVEAVFVPSPSNPNINSYTVNGQPLIGNYDIYLDQKTVSDGSGNFTLNLLDNHAVSPAGSTYKFTIKSYTSAQASTFPNLAMTSGTNDISAFITANITAPRFAATSGQYGGAYGYGINEVAVIPVPGGSFFNVTNLTIEVWNGTSWQVQAIGSFCSSVSCHFTDSVFSPNINNVCEASQQAGADFVAQIIACQNQSYMAAGGMITAYGYGNTTQTATTVLHSLGGDSQPIFLGLNPATNFVWNQNVGTSNSASSCIVPLANGSKISGVGFVSFAKVNFSIGPNAVLNDFMCNLHWDGTQEAMQIDGITLRGNINATKTGSLLHLVNVFAGTVINNFATYLPYGPGVTVDSGSDIKFNDSIISDSAPSGQYPGATLTLNCPDKFTYNGGAIQDNGIFNPLMIITSVGCNSQGGGSSLPFAAHFYNVDWEIQAATIGSFSGHATNVDPIQLVDPSDILIDSILLFGNRGAGQQHIVDISSNNGPRGPVELDNVQAVSPIWGAGDVLINNIGGSNTTVAPQLQAVHGKVSGGTVSIGKYRWTGSLASNGNYNIDYEDVKNFSSTTTNLLNVVPVPYSGLGTCNSGLEGQLQSVTDSTSGTPGQVITTGGGTFHVQLYCNGTSWAVAAGQSTKLAQQFTICALGCTYNTTICTTNGSTGWAGGGCTVGTFNWPVPFADTNYSLSCMPLTPLLGGGQPIAAFIYNQGGSNKTTTGIAIGLMVPNAAATTVQEIDCQGVHN